MTTVYVYPRPGLSVPFPTAEDSALAAGGDFATLTDYIDGLIRTRQVLTYDPDGGPLPDPDGDNTPRTGIVDYVSDIMGLTASYGGGSSSETVYLNGAFIYPFLGSTLNLTTGSYSIVRSGGWPPGVSIVEDAPFAGQAPVRAYAWEDDVSSYPYLQPMIDIGDDPEDPVASAARSNTLTGPLVLRYRMTHGFASDAGDRAPTGISTWKNVTYAAASARVAADLSAFLTSYVAAGGRTPEFVAVNLEDFATTYYIDPQAMPDQVNNYTENWNWLVKNRVYQARLVDKGYAAPTDVFSSAANVVEYQNIVMRLADEALQECVLQTVQSFFPYCKLSNYAEFLMSQANANLCASRSSFREYFTSIPGTHSSPEMYGTIGSAGGFYGYGPYNCLRWEVNRFRGMYRTNPVVPIAPWVCYSSYAAGEYLSDQAYSSELYRHLVLCGAERLLYFNDPFFPDAAANARMNTVIAELQGRFGNKTRRTVTTADMPVTPGYPSAFVSGPLVVSGMLCDGTYHWRCSFPASTTTVTANGVNVPLVSGERGVWHTTTTPTVPTFVAT